MFAVKANERKTTQILAFPCVVYLQKCHDVHKPNKAISTDTDSTQHFPTRQSTLGNEVTQAQALVQ